MTEEYDLRHSGPGGECDSYMFVIRPEGTSFEDLVSKLRRESVNPLNMEDFSRGGKDPDNFFYPVYELKSPQEWLDVHPEDAKNRVIAIKIPDSTRIPGTKIYDGMCEDSKKGLLVTRYVMLKGEDEVEKIDLSEAEFVNLAE